MGRVVMTSWSFPKAIRLPEKVTSPIRVPSMMVTATSFGMPSAVSRSLTNSAAAMRADAPPPRPLKTATICGMAVILIVRARTPPTTAPTSIPTTISS